MAEGGDELPENGDLSSQEDATESVAERLLRPAGAGGPPLHYLCHTLSHYSGHHDWARAICTLLPSRRASSDRKASIAAVTLPRMSRHVEEDSHALRVRRQLSNADHRRRPASFYAEQASRTRSPAYRRSYSCSDSVFEEDDERDDGQEEPMSEQEQAELLAAIKNLPVPLAMRRIFRNRLQKAPYHHGEKFDMWDFKSLKAMRKASEIWKDVSSFLTMWSNSLKQIEGHYGTGVASYFLFLRWLLFLNLLMFFLPLLLIIIPHFVFPKTSTSLPLSHLLVPSPFTVLPINATTGYSTSSPAPFAAAFTAEEMSNRTSQLAEECYTMYRVRVTEATGGGISYLQDFLQGTGWMELTALFAGRYYEAVESLPSTRLPYNFPLAYILANICCFLLCLLMMIRYTTVGVRETLLVSEGKLHQYCNLVFASWDFCITDERTARLKRISIIQELKSYLAEERRDAELAQWSRSKKITLLVVRFFTNLVVLIIIAASLYAVYVATSASFGEQASSDGSSKDGFWALVVQFIPSLVITGLNIVIPGVFSHLIRFENYSTAFEIKLTLLRTVFLRFTSIFVLLISLYKQINCEKGEQGVCFEGKDDVCKKPVCWETAVGQQIYKLTLLDFVVGVALVFLIELPRRLLVTRVDSKLTKWIGRPEFSIPTRVLDLVYSQTLCWLGTFYCPILPAISILKYFIIFYVQKYTLMNNSGPLQTSYRASRSNTFFMIVLMLALFLVIVPFGYALVEIPPSVACGPFRHFGSTWDVVKDTVRRWGWPLQNIVSFLTSMACALPTVFILVICIYSYLSVSAAHRHMEKVLKDKLVLEGKDKQFLLARITEVARQQAASNR
ncbi:transmembrane channel-like protein 7 isoform X2 [Ornithodoros turicata]|uniref:transmembrane channel-like protein 7 isoform X2 n=1 Tax=Ornithodoros turicata TaxID=34597 RepID=UPI00313981F2